MPHFTPLTGLEPVALSTTRTATAWRHAGGSIWDRTFKGAQQLAAFVRQADENTWAWQAWDRPNALTEGGKRQEGYGDTQGAAQIAVDLWLTAHGVILQ